MSIVACCAVPHPPLIVPAVGCGRESGISDTIAAYEEVARRIAALQPETLVIMSPHATAYRDAFHVSGGTGATGSFARFGAPQARYEVTYDQELARAIIDLAQERGVECGTYRELEPDLDNGTMVPLHFICEHIPVPRIVRIGLSGLPRTDHYLLGEAIEKACEQLGRKAVFVASGDLSHKLTHDGPYGFAPEGPEFDACMADTFASGDFSQLLTLDEGFCDAAAECGLRSFTTMAGTMDGHPVTCELLSCEGPFGVGYGVAWFVPDRTLEDTSRRFAETGGLGPVSDDPLVQLAILSLEHKVRTGNMLDWPVEVPRDLYNRLGDAMSRAAGAFVSIHKNGDLRGCIGTIGPTQKNLAIEIVRNAVLASTQDPRFSPIRPDELADLEVNVDVLGEPEDIDGTDQLDVRRYGVIVSCGMRRGLLLPDLEGVDTVEDQVSIARRKGGIGPNEPYTLQRFEVVRHR